LGRERERERQGERGGGKSKNSLKRSKSNDLCTTKNSCKRCTHDIICLGNGANNNDPICKSDLNLYAAGENGLTIECDSQMSGQYVTISSSTWIVVCEIEVYPNRLGIILHMISI